MVSWTQLALPVLLAVVLVFLSSSVIHMLLKWHTPDYRKLPNEDEVRAAINKGSPAPAQYILPHCLDPKQAAEEGMKHKFSQGPVGVLWLKPAGQMQLGPFLLKWVAYTVVVSALVAYLARASVEPGAPYLEVFRLVGTTAWLAYAWAGPADSIWKGKPWVCTARDLGDGLVYALLTAGAFAWLWP